MKTDKIMMAVKERLFVGLFLYLVIAITLLFFINLYLDKPLTLDTVNNWVSLILGLVATIFSIISMWLSFYSLEKANEKNEENIHSMNKLKEEILNRVEKTNQIYLQHFQELKGKMDLTSEQLNDIKHKVDSGKTNLNVEQVADVRYESSESEYDVGEEDVK